MWERWELKLYFYVSTEGQKKEIQVRCEIWVYRTPTAWCDADFCRLEIYGAVGTEVLFEGISVLLGS